MKIIKDYLDSLFLTVPITEATKQAKAELLEIMEDHYYESINEGKSENEAIGEVISEFGSIDEILAELEVENATLEQEGDEEEETVALEALTEEEVFDFWSTTRKLAFEFGLGVFLAILSISMLFLAYYGDAFFILCFFLCLIGGLFLLIYSIFKYYYAIRSMNHRKLETALQEEASHQSQDYQKSFIVGSILGLLAIALTFPIILFFFNSRLLKKFYLHPNQPVTHILCQIISKVCELLFNYSYIKIIFVLRAKSIDQNPKIHYSI